MICSCGFNGQFGEIYANSSDGRVSLIGTFPSEDGRGTHIGSVHIFVCPSCGMLLSDMRGRIDLNRKLKTINEGFIDESEA